MVACTMYVGLSRISLYTYAIPFLRGDWSWWSRKILQRFTDRVSVIILHESVSDSVSRSHVPDILTTTAQSAVSPPLGAPANPFCSFLLGRKRFQAQAELEFIKFRAAP